MGIKTVTQKEQTRSYLKLDEYNGRFSLTMSISAKPREKGEESDLDVLTEQIQDGVGFMKISVAKVVKEADGKEYAMVPVRSWKGTDGKENKGTSGYWNMFIAK